MVLEGLTIASGALVGTAVDAGAEVPPVDGAEVGVADEPQASIAASRSVNEPRIKNFGVFNQLIKMNQPHN
jgi:hypothetical protein